MASASDDLAWVQSGKGCLLCQSLVSRANVSPLSLGAERLALATVGCRGGTDVFENTTWFS